MLERRVGVSAAKRVGSLLFGCNPPFVGVADGLKWCIVEQREVGVGMVTITMRSLSWCTG